MSSVPSYPMSPANELLELSIGDQIVSVNVSDALVALDLFQAQVSQQDSKIVWLRIFRIK